MFNNIWIKGFWVICLIFSLTMLLSAGGSKKFQEAKILWEIEKDDEWQHPFDNDEGSEVLNVVSIENWRKNTDSMNFIRYSIDLQSGKIVDQKKSPHKEGIFSNDKKYKNYYIKIYKRYISNYMQGFCDTMLEFYRNGDNKKIFTYDFVEEKGNKEYKSRIWNFIEDKKIFMTIQPIVEKKTMYTELIAYNVETGAKVYEVKFDGLIKKHFITKDNNKVVIIGYEPEKYNIKAGQMEDAVTSIKVVDLSKGETVLAINTVFDLMKYMKEEGVVHFYMGDNNNLLVISTMNPSNLIIIDLAQDNLVSTIEYYKGSISLTRALFCKVTKQYMLIEILDNKGSSSAVCIDVLNSKVLWEKKINKSKLKNDIFYSIIDEELYLINFKDGSISKVNAIDGEEIWKSEKLSNFSLVQLMKDSAILNLDNKSLCSLNLKSGQLNWKSDKLSSTNVISINKIEKNACEILESKLYFIEKNKIKIVNLEDGKLVNELETKSNYIKKIKVIEKKNYIFVFSSNLISIYDLDRKELLNEIRFPFLGKFVEFKLIGDYLLASTYMHNGYTNANYIEYYLYDLKNKEPVWSIKSDNTYTFTVPDEYITKNSTRVKMDDFVNADDIPFLCNGEFFKKNVLVLSSQVFFNFVIKAYRFFPENNVPNDTDVEQMERFTMSFKRK